MVIPWTIAEHAAESTVWIWSRLIRATCVLLSPIIVLARLIEEIVRRLLRAKPQDDTERHEAELLSVVEEGERAGEFDETERDMIEAVVEFRSQNVDQIMTPRTEIRAMALTDNLGEVTRICKEIGHSRIPVFEDDLDHIVGIFYVKDLLRWLADDRENGNREPFSLRKIVREAVFVPETKTVRELLVELLAKRVHIAMVADEYGGTAGLVTIEDIVEEVFGEIQDEYESPDESPPGVTLNTESGEADIDARAYIDDANDELEPLGVALPESEEYDTVGGFVVTALGRIPDEGETLRVGPAVMTVLEAQPTRVIKLRLAVAPEGESAIADTTPLGEALHNGHSESPDPAPSGPGDHTGAGGPPSR
jgi:CBS domain containing-hemolysin-like protein